jgi:hypothetical protein
MVEKDIFSSKKDSLQEFSQVSSVKIAMPSSVIATIVIISVLMIMTFFSKQSNARLYATVCFILILIGVIKRHPLAWQWGRIIPTIWVFTGLLTLAGSLENRWHDITALNIFISLLIGILLPGIIPVLFSFQSSRIYFGLKCPACSAIEGKAANIMFSMIRCRKCGNVWSR